MYIHKDKTDKLNLHKLAGAFNKRRVDYFGNFSLSFFTLSAWIDLFLGWGNGVVLLPPIPLDSTSVDSIASVASLL